MSIDVQVRDVAITAGDSSAAPSVRIDAAGRIVAADDAAATLLGLDPGDIVGADLVALTARCRGSRASEVLLVALAAPEPDGAVAVAQLRDPAARRLTERLEAADAAVVHAFAGGETPTEAVARLLAVLARALGATRADVFTRGHDGTPEAVAHWPPAAAGGARRPDAIVLANHTLDTGEIARSRDDGLAVALGRGDTPRSAVVLTVAEIPSPASLAVLAEVAARAGELLEILQDRHSRIESLARLALTDELTGLPNRRAWEEMLARELARAARDGQPVCVAVLDLDAFKAYNDTHGHQAGDRLLRDAAHAWQRQLRLSDLLARYGGEEFAAIIPAWPLPIATGVVERLRRATPGGLTASAGVAAWDGSESGAELFGRADAALYEAKQAGRDRTVAADPPPDPDGPAG